MKGFLLASLVLATMSACGTGDDVALGARANCAQGGALTDCPDAERTSEGACWRLVDCGAIPLDHPEEFRIDWGTCVDGLDGLTADRQRLVVSCIAASTCDQLQVDGSPEQPNRDQMYCLRLGED
ncbi:MAG: hypothetical protein H0T42_03175 [Deltaproteobacteria bacterium]|nr:hypothetical protein [Deltaproteobacteria bacterium]